MQSQGIPTGSPISVIIANMVMDYIENTTINSNYNKLLFYERYIDVVLDSCPKKDADLVLSILNDLNSKIQFTKEMEKNNQINFLDITIIREPDNYITTNWFTKPTWIGRYINWNSNTPSQYKSNVVNNMLNRVLTFSNIKFRNSNLNKLKCALIKNDYTEKFVNKLIKRRIHRFYN